MNKNKTKIICTIGPASSSKEVMRHMIENGMNVARINLSHGDYTFCDKIINSIRDLNRELHTSVGVMLDTKGPEIRLGDFDQGKAELKERHFIKLVNEEVLGDEFKFSISYKDLYKEIRINDRILLDDGKIELKVVDIDNTIIVCEIMQNGTIYNHKGVNLPDTHLKMKFLSEKDRQDITYASSKDVDFIALSFVRTSEDVLEVNDLLIELGNDRLNIISKIENQEAVSNIDSIIDVSDGIMIARGDLGVELAFEKVPAIQKMIVEKCHNANKVSIVATEMLSSMEHNARPTRAEVSDIANAVLDGADAIMLSGETTVGDYPIETVDVMNKIAVSTEEEIDYVSYLEDVMRSERQDITTTIAYSVVDAANRLKVNAIVASTMSGYTAMRISKFRPYSIILAPTPDRKVARKLTLSFGVYPVIVKEFKSTDEIVDNAKTVATDLLHLEKGDRIIITGGFPTKQVKHTNFMKIEEI